MTLLRIDASIQGPRSVSSELADLVLAEWTAARPDEPVVRRHLGTDPVPATTWTDALAAAATPEDRHTDRQRAALKLARTLVDELRDADAAVFAFPLYNFGVSQHVKTWIDVVSAGRRKDEQPIQGKPVVLVTSRGGSYAPGQHRDGWDHNTGFLRHVIGDLWGADLTVVERELTLYGLNPVYDGMGEVAALLKKTAHEAAAAAGRALVTR